MRYSLQNQPFFALTAFLLQQHGWPILLGCWAACVAISSNAAPLPVDNPVALRIQGSNTIGAELSPALVKALLTSNAFKNAHAVPGANENEQHLVGTAPGGQNIIVELAAHGSGTGFVGLKNSQADLAASSRPIKDAEVGDLKSLGDLRSAGAEHVIGIDGVAVIVNAKNSLNSLSTQQLANIFSGEAKNWEDVGGHGGEIHLYARDEQSGTFDTFKELVLGSRGKKLASSAKRFESNETLADTVSGDVQGIGFTSFSALRQAKALSVSDGESQAMLPTLQLIATEDYPLSRRLFFYYPPSNKNPWAQALVSFSESPQGQDIVTANGFIGQTPQTIQVEPTASMPAKYQQLAKDARRLSINFRFAEGSATLDNKAQADIQRVVTYLKSHDKLKGQVALYGFDDANPNQERAQLISKLRAMVVLRALAKQGALIRDFDGFGSLRPVASNDSEEGRIKNRRVEVWVY